MPRWFSPLCHLAVSALPMLAAVSFSSTGYAQLTPNQILLPPAPTGATAHSVSGVNFDGSRIFGGASYTSAANRPFLWTGGATSGDLGAHISPVTNTAFSFNGFGAVGSNAVSDDGLSLAGTSSSSGTPARGWVWRSATGYQDLGLPSGFGGVSAFAISRDGSTVVGQTSLNQTRAYRWRNGTFEVLGLPSISGETYSSTAALGTNANGDVIVGTATRTAPTSLTLPMIWRSGTGFEIIQTGYGSGAGQARAVSADGTIVGGRALPNANNERIFRRLANGSIQLIDPLAGDLWTEFTGMSADGSRIVGRSGNSGGSATWRAILWTASDGARSINDIVAGLGISHPYSFINASGISGDGSTIVGTARNLQTSTNLPFALRLLQIVRLPTQSQSLTQLLTPDAITQNFTNTTYDTTVKTILDGRLLNSQQFDVIASAAPVQSALDAARDVIRAAAGLRRVEIQPPARERSETVVTQVTGPIETQIVESLPSQTFSIETQGPATIATGDRGVCTNPGANGVFPSGCTLPGTPLTLAANEISDHTHTANFQRVTRVLTTTTDQVLEEVYAVRGAIGSQAGAIHVLASALSLRAGERLVRRLLDERPGSLDTRQARLSEPVKVAGAGWPATAQQDLWSVFVEGYGVFGSLDGQPRAGVASADYEGDGLTGAAAWRPIENFMLGAAVEFGARSGDIADPVNPERLDLDFTQAGLYAAWAQDWLQLNAAATTGQASLDTRIHDGAPVNAARYDISFWAAGVSASADVPLGRAAFLSPEIGALWAGAERDAFSETGGGPMALTGPGDTSAAQKLWAGLRLRAEFELETGSVLEPSAYVRYVRRSGDIDGRARLALKAFPGTVLEAAGPAAGRDALEAGFSAAVYAKDGLAVELRYDGAYSKDAAEHSVQAALTLRF